MPWLSSCSKCSSMYCSSGSHSSLSLRIRLQYEQMGSNTSSCSISLRNPRMRSATLSRARSSSGSTGLAMKSSAPASMPAKYCCLPPRDVTRMKYTYGSRVRARIRRHSSGPSISGMYQSEMMMGTRASWSSSHASRPLGALLTSYPAAFASAPSWALATGSSSTTSTGIALGIRPAFRCRTKIVERGLRLAAYVLKFVPRPSHVAIPRRALHVLQQRGEVARADRPRGRLERMRRPLQRLGLGTARRRHQGLQALRQGRHEGLEDPVHRFGRPRLLHGASEGREVYRGGPCRGGVGRLGAPPFDGGEQVVRLERLREIATHPTLQAALALPAQRVGREGDDRERPSLRQGTNLLRRLEPVHPGHLDIHQDDVVTLLGDGVHRFAAVAHDVHLVAPLQEHGRRHLLVHRVVLRQQDPQRVARLGDRVARDEVDLAWRRRGARQHRPP